MLFRPAPDDPGANTALRPHDAPAWMEPAYGAEELVAQRLRVDDKWGEIPAKREAAVLVLLSGRSADDAEVLLTHRSPSMRSHSGQIAFPGGRVDPGDVNQVDAALREAWEETGLDRHSVVPAELWGTMRIRATGNPVRPVLAHWSQPVEVGVTNPAEADDVFTVPLQELADPDNRLAVGWGNWQGPAFRIRDYIIWGFTGGILAALMDHAGWAHEWDRERVCDLREVLEGSRNNERMR